MAYLTIYEKVFSKNKEAGKRLAREEMGDDTEDEVTFDGLDFVPEVEFDKDTGQLAIFGSLDTPENKSLAFISTDVNIDLDLAVSIIEYYMKKLGKLKTILEATK